MKSVGRIMSFILLLASFTAARGTDFSATIFDQKDYISPWSLYEPGGMHYAFLYTNGVRFGSNTAGPFEVKGHWLGKVFLSADSSGKDVETAKIQDDGSLEIHAALFNPGDANDYVLHKVVPGHPSASAAVANPPPAPPDNNPKLAWPPPKGAITIGMTLEDLEKLPWHRDGLRQAHDNPRAEVFIYTYHCDDPALVDLTVTVKNGRVVMINGGRG